MSRVWHSFEEKVAREFDPPAPPPDPNEHKLIPRWTEKNHTGEMLRDEVSDSATHSALPTPCTSLSVGRARPTLCTVCVAQVNERNKKAGYSPTKNEFAKDKLSPRKIGSHWTGRMFAHSDNPAAEAAAAARGEASAARGADGGQALPYMGAAPGRSLEFDARRCQVPHVGWRFEY